jgi:hypothetical protein
VIMRRNRKRNTHDEERGRTRISRLRGPHDRRGAAPIAPAPP